MMRSRLSRLQPCRKKLDRPRQRGSAGGGFKKRSTVGTHIFDDTPPRSIIAKWRLNSPLKTLVVPQNSRSLATI